MNAIDPVVLMRTPVDKIERDMIAQFGHWSHHLGNEQPASVKYKGG